MAPDAGKVAQPVATPTVFFWYAEEGIYILQADDLAWVFERIKPAMTYDVGQPALTLDTAPSLMWFNERLWVSVDYQSDDNLSGSNQVQPAQHVRVGPVVGSDWGVDPA